MQNFIFENPTRIILGEGRISLIGREVQHFGSRVLLVYGQGSIKRNGIYQQVVTSLQKAGIYIVELSGVKSNPVLSLVLKGIELARKEQVDVILAAGGGSVIDTAKTVAAGVKSEYDVWDFFTYKKTINDALPILTVVTVSASASEMNPVAVITNEKSAQKLSISSLFIQPKASILDPTALYTLSPQYSAYSAVDAITHVLEGYFNNSEPDSPLQDRFVEAIIKTIMESTEIILKNPTDYNARANMMWSATLALNGLTTAGMGQISFPAHMIEHSLSALYDIAHGAGLSIVLPGWMSYTIKRNSFKLARLAREIFDVKEMNDEKAATECVYHLKSWFASIGSPTSLRDGNIIEEDIEKIAENAIVSAQLWKLREYTKDVIVEILNLCR